MLNGIKGIQRPTFWIRTGGVVKGSTFQDHGKFRIGGIGRHKTIKSYKVVLDEQLTPNQTRRIRDWFTDVSMSTTELKKVADMENLPEIMDKVDAIAISPDFEDNCLRKKGIVNRANVLALRLEDVLLVVTKFEEEKANRIDLQRGTILDLVDPDGTILDPGQMDKFAGGYLYRKAVYHLFRPKVKVVYKKDDSGFYKMLEQAFGKGFDLGTFEPEFAIAHELIVIRGELPLHVLGNMIAAVKEDKFPGEALTMLLRSNAPDYIEQTNKRVEARSRKYCTRLYTRLLGFAPHTRFEQKDIRKTIAMLTLGIRSGQLVQKDVEQFVKGEYDPKSDKNEIERKTEDFLTEVRNQIKNEVKGKKGIFSLGLVIDIISEIKIS